ncbi:Retrotransposon gag domain [Arabidopsis thaliana x Arabidopsis arenosa]|uniref:Retrotransposon gag domain n=1 Tax=Arabidopsis thaliana x Arabidopsis arenosa TaxID=1240361 RepID=A0A8T2BFK3_9BRAS|nr:Retrotransposon gag domain [Arabidopsis thaliana x Arabidopsis arenosa]
MLKDLSEKSDQQQLAASYSEVRLAHNAYVDRVEIITAGTLRIGGPRGRLDFHDPNASETQDPRTVTPGQVLPTSLLPGSQGELGGGSQQPNASQAPPFGPYTSAAAATVRTPLPFHPKTTPRHPQSELDQISAPEVNRVIEETRRIPFTPRITALQIQNTREVKLPGYNGKVDPKEYLTSFQVTAGRVSLEPEEIDDGLCKLFAENLSGPALTWFTQLKEGSIDNFKQLSTAFIMQYEYFIKSDVTDAQLWNLSQGAGEPLYDYIMSFKEIMVQDALHRDTNWINAKEERAALPNKFKAVPKQAKPSPQRKPVHAETRKLGAETLSVDREEPKCSPKKSPAKSSFSPKNKNRALSSNKWVRDPNSYCKIHKVNGQATKDYKALGRLLAAKFAHGEITEVDDSDLEPSQAPGQSTDSEEPSPPEQKAEDSPGFEYPESAIKQYKRKANSPLINKAKLSREQLPEITFSENEIDLLDKPHDDALVITLDIAHCEIHDIYLFRDPRRPTTSPEFSNARSGVEDGGRRINPNPSSLLLPSSLSHSPKVVQQLTFLACSEAKTSGEASFNFDHQLTSVLMPHTKLQLSSERVARVFLFLTFPILAHIGSSFGLFLEVAV